jgi:hypothetical protein
MIEKVVNVGAMVVVVAGIAVVVQSRFTSQVIEALGNAFSGAIRAAQGQVAK